jgi:hypothetical protein
MITWKTVLISLYYFATFLLGIFSFLRIYVWTKSLPISNKSTVISSKSESVDFPDFTNGLIVLSDAANSAGTYVWIVGGQAPGVLLGGSGGGNSVQPEFGSLTYNNTIKGYTWLKPQNFPLPFITMNFVKISL